MPWRPGARELLAALNVRGVPCALVTMSWQHPTDEVVRQLPPGSFQAVITGDMVMNGKPHPEPYRRAAEELGVDPLSCVAIEDSPTGVASAEAAGCVVVAVRNSCRSRRRRIASCCRPWRASPPSSSVSSSNAHRRLRADRQRPRRRRRRRHAAGPRPASRPVDRGCSVPSPPSCSCSLSASGGSPSATPGRATTPGPFNVHAWVPGWALEAELDDFAPRSNLFHQISPFWYEVTGLTTSLFDDTDEDSSTSSHRGARPRRAGRRRRCPTGRPRA